MADWMEELERLAELRDKGLITEEEFEAERVKIVPSAEDSRALDTKTSAGPKDIPQIPAPNGPKSPHGSKSHLKKRGSDQPPPPQKMTRERYKRLERVSFQDQRLKNMAWRWRRKYYLSNFMLLGCYISAIVISAGYFVSASIAFGIFAVLSFFIRSKARKELLECGFAEVYIPLYGILTRLNRWFSGFSPPIFWLDHTWPKRTWAGENPWLCEEIFGFTDELRDISCAKCGPKVFIPSEHHPDGYILFRCSACDETLTSKNPLLKPYSEEERIECLDGMRKEMEYWSNIDPVYFPEKGHSSREVTIDRRSMFRYFLARYGLGAS